MSDVKGAFVAGRDGVEIIIDDERMEWIPVEWLNAAYAAYFDYFHRQPLEPSEIDRYILKENWAQQ